MALVIGWFLDLIFGDPQRLPHPIVWFGKWIAMGEKRLNKDRHRKLKGALFVTISIALLFGISWALLNLLPIHHSHPLFEPQYGSNARQGLGNCLHLGLVFRDYLQGNP